MAQKISTSQISIPRFRAVKDSTQAISGSTVTQLSFPIVEFNEGDYYSNNEFTAPIDGDYQFNTAITFVKSAATSSTYSFALQVNEVSRSIKRGTTTTTLPDGAGISDLIRLEAGDKVRIAVYYGGSASSTIEVSNGYNYFSGYLVSAVGS